MRVPSSSMRSQNEDHPQRRAADPRAARSTDGLSSRLRIIPPLCKPPSLFCFVHTRAWAMGCVVGVLPIDALPPRRLISLRTMGTQTSFSPHSTLLTPMLVTGTQTSVSPHSTLLTPTLLTGMRSRSNRVSQVAPTPGTPPPPPVQSGSPMWPPRQPYASAFAL
jgi:hypothetical protein